MDIVLVGAGAMALETEQYILACNRAGLGLRKADGTAVAHATITGLVFAGHGRVSEFQSRPPHIGEPQNHAPTGAHYLIAIGAPDARRRVWMELAARGAQFASVIHPSCVVATDATIGAGTILCPFAFAGSASAIGANVILNTYASTGHDSRIGAHCVLSPYACLNGGAALGEACFMGSNALVAPQKKVGRFSKLAAGAVLFADAPPGSLMAGNPARGRQMFPVPADSAE